jgi:hypothetical protein
MQYEFVIRQEKISPDWDNQQTNGDFFFFPKISRTLLNK